MADFTYKARKRGGEAVEGVIQAADRGAALLQLQKSGLFPVALQAAKPGSVPKTRRTSTQGQSGRPAAEGGRLLPAVIRDLASRQRRPGMKELATYTQQLANLLRSGMPLTAALNSMCNLETRGIRSEVSQQVRQDVLEGKSLSAAMARQSTIFPPLVINMVEAGEQSGALEDVLKRLATHFERFSEVQSRFTSAMIYPSMVACVGIVIIFAFMSFMLPKFLEIFEGINIPLPTPTRILIGISHFFGTYWWVVLLALIGAVVLFTRFKSSERGRRILDGWMLKLPVFGRIVQLNLFGQFSRTLSTLLHNGVPVLTALKITEQVVPNVLIREAIATTREGVTDGKTLAQPLAKSGMFPQLMIDLIKIGEETGDVPGTLGNLADTYENDLSVALRVMTNLIEPVMIIAIAVAVGFLLYSVLAAMFEITRVVGQ